MQDASTAKLKALFDKAADAIIITDAEGVMVDLNSATTTMFGYCTDELIGHNFKILIPEPRAENRDSLIAQYLASEPGTFLGGARRMEGRRKNGANFPISLTVTRLDLDEGRFFAGIVRDLTHILHTEELVRSRRQILDAIFEASPDAVKVVDTQLSTTENNPAAAQILGVPVAEIRGSSPLDAVHPEDKAIVASALSKLLAGHEGPVTLHYRVRHSDGHWISIEARGRTLLDDNDKPLGVVTVERDISEAIAIRQALETAKLAAERANQEKSQFLSRISHELRTPLNSILGFSQIMRMDLLTPDQEESVGHIYRAGKHLLSLIDEVLDISRIEAGTITISLEPVRLNELTSECISLVSPQAQERGIGVRVSGDRDRYVRADKQRLKQVILNLLSNAVKFNSDRGSITLSCEGGDDQVRISISDTGPGITTELRDRIFTPFDRLDAESKGIEGTGLGLALSKRLTEVMGGELGYESVPGEGSTFYVDLPAIAAPSRAGKSVANPGASLSRTPRGTLLYVEDNLANVTLIERLLKRRPNVHLVSALQGSLGLELAVQHHPDLIMLDVHLPDMNGLEVLERLRAAPRCSDIPVAILSADATQSQMKRFLNAGAIDYLTKPLELERLLSLIDEHLTGTGGTQGSGYGSNSTLG